MQAASQGPASAAPAPAWRSLLGSAGASAGWEWAHGWATVRQKRKLGAAGGGRGSERDKRRRGEGERGGGDAVARAGEGEGRGRGRRRRKRSAACAGAGGGRVPRASEPSANCDAARGVGVLDVRSAEPPRRQRSRERQQQHQHQQDSSTTAGKRQRAARGDAGGSEREPAAARGRPRGRVLPVRRPACFHGAASLRSPRPRRCTTRFPATLTPHPTGLRPVPVPAPRPCAAARAALALPRAHHAERGVPPRAYAHAGAAKRSVHLVGPPLDLALDARGAGARARWVRSGCWPNAELRAYVCGGGTGEGGRRAGDGRGSPASPERIRDLCDAGAEGGRKGLTLQGRRTVERTKGHMSVSPRLRQSPQTPHLNVPPFRRPPAPALSASPFHTASPSPLALHRPRIHRWHERRGARKCDILCPWGRADECA
ncbi:hypothetical protein FB451DRAFT_1446832 [Mycena latifolia]|nr:hypothetical protein FB451DRAFT_1446832 [Mycena latifolia]